MTVAVERVIAASARDFRDIVWPCFAERFQHGSLIPVESVTDSNFTRLLDQQSGIDAWHVVSTGGIRGIASRVQWKGRFWESWTVRTRLRSGRPTEYHKLTTLDMTLLRPAYHIQAYLVQPGGPLRGAACMETTGLIRMLLAGKHGKELPHPDGQSWFVPVWWDDAEREGLEVWRA